MACGLLLQPHRPGSGGPLRTAVDALTIDAVYVSVN